ncbi:MAG: dihydroxyacetone kinase subunit L [Actinobacteria bacterium]|nr:MAG: dihydroxyacetone kinase subunit L [Actinomycetota bacterium]
MREQRSKGAAGTAAGDGEASLGAAFVIQWVNELASAVRDQRDYLTQLDAAIGDADHGINLDRGLRAAVAKLEGMEQEAPGIILEAVGTALTFTVGGAAGPLYGSGFRDLGRALGSKERFGPEDLLVALRSGLGAIQKLGAAAVGDKTIVDAFVPGLAAFERGLRAGAGWPAAATRARQAAEDGMRATVPLQARKGRASYLGPRSMGHQDPGATSTALLFSALERAAGGTASAAGEPP